MLVLNRRVNEEVVCRVGDVELRVRVCSFGRQSVKLGFVAPEGVVILRGELDPTILSSKERDVSFSDVELWDGKAEVTFRDGEDGLTVVGLTVYFDEWPATSKELLRLAVKLAGHAQLFEEDGTDGVPIRAWTFSAPERLPRSVADEVVEAVGVDRILEGLREEETDG